MARLLGWTLKVKCEISQKPSNRQPLQGLSQYIGLRKGRLKKGRDKYSAFFHNRSGRSLVILIRTKHAGHHFQIDGIPSPKIELLL